MMETHRYWLSQHAYIIRGNYRALDKLMAEYKEQAEQIDALKAHLEELKGWLGLTYTFPAATKDEFEERRMKIAGAVAKTSEQSLEERDRKIYNKAIEDADNALIDCDWHPEYGIDELQQAIRQLKKGE